MFNAFKMIHTHSLKPLLFLFIQPRKDRQLCLYKDVEWNWNDKYQVTSVCVYYYPGRPFSEIKTRANERGGQFKNPLYYRKKLNRRVRSCAPIFGCLLCRGHRRRNAALYFQSITFFSSCSRLPFSNKKKEIWSPPRIIIILFLFFLSVGKERIPMFENDLFDLVEAAAAVRRKTRPICVRSVERIRG